jgi:hypothetical protein
MAPLLARMKAEETRKTALLEELATLDGAAGLGDLALARTQRVLRAKAADVRGALVRRPDEAKAVLGAFVQTLTLEPVGMGRARGYRFAGTGSGEPRGRGANPLLDQLTLRAQDADLAFLLVQVDANMVHAGPLFIAALTAVHPVGQHLPPR